MYPLFTIMLGVTGIISLVFVIIYSIYQWMMSAISNLIFKGNYESKLSITNLFRVKFILDQFESSSFNSNLKVFNEGCCPICFCEFGQNTVVFKMKECDHYFHKKCLGDWIESCVYDTCPYCRKNFNREKYIN